jgi:hypothetical protein
LSGLVEDDGLFAGVDHDVDLEHENQHEQDDQSNQNIFPYVLGHVASVFKDLLDVFHGSSVCN